VASPKLLFFYSPIPPLHPNSSRPLSELERFYSYSRPSLVATVVSSTCVQFLNLRRAPLIKERFFRLSSSFPLGFFRHPCSSTRVRVVTMSPYPQNMSPCRSHAIFTVLYRSFEIFLPAMLTTFRSYRILSPCALEFGALRARRHPFCVRSSVFLFPFGPFPRAASTFAHSSRPDELSLGSCSSFSADVPLLNPSLMHPPCRFTPHRAHPQSSLCVDDFLPRLLAESSQLLTLVLVRSLFPEDFPTYVPPPPSRILVVRMSIFGMEPPFSPLNLLCSSRNFQMQFRLLTPCASPFPPSPSSSSGLHEPEVLSTPRPRVLCTDFPQPSRITRTFF